MKHSITILAALAAMTCAHAEQLSGVLEVGDYEGATAMVEGSFWDSAPTTFYVAHTGSQILYTAGDLASLADLNEVKISSLTYRYANTAAYYDITRNVTVYLQQVDATEFAKIEGVKQFFDFDADAPAYDAEVTYEFVDSYGDDGELTFTFDEPVAIDPALGLVVTVVMDAVDDDNCLDSSFDLQFYSTGVRNRAMTFTNNHVSFLDYKDTEDFPDATSVLGCGTAIDQPVTRIAYVYTAGQAVKGDVNGDGVVDVDDVNIVVNVILDIDSNAAADVDGNGGVDVEDMNEVINILLAN